MSHIQSKLVDDTLNITLPEVLDAPAAGALRELVMASVHDDMTVRLDSAQIAQMTTPGAQVLIAAADFIARHKARFVLANPSDALVEAFGDLGLFSLLMTWEAE